MTDRTAWDRARVCAAAEIASLRFGQWVPQRWLELFMDAYEASAPNGEGVYYPSGPEAMTERKRERCAAIADGLVIAIKMGAGTGNSAEFRRGCIAAGEWIRDEIKRARTDRE